jgi:hypothetical protein
MDYLLPTSFQEIILSIRIHDQLNLIAKLPKYVMLLSKNFADVYLHEGVAYARVSGLQSEYDTDLIHFFYEDFSLMRIWLTRKFFTETVIRFDYLVSLRRWWRW